MSINTPTSPRFIRDGLHETIAAGLRESDQIEARTATLDQPEHGLTEAVLAETDVLTWWGHAAHAQVEDRIVERVQKRVLQAMGLIVLHSGHYSKIFKRLLGTTCSLTWREAGEKERLWVCNPAHPIARGIDRSLRFRTRRCTASRSPFPIPDEVMFLSWFAGGEVFRSGCTWRRGAGKIFYFRPGHESYPTYHQKEVRQVIRNAVLWARPEGAWIDSCPNIPYDQAPEKIVPFGRTLHKPGEEGFK